MKYLLVLALSLHATLAAADPKAKAESLFRQGRDLMTAKKYIEACSAFDASQKLDPATTTLFNQADCREKNGQLATAWGLFVEAERQTRGAGDVSERLHQVALQRAAKLEGRLSKLTIKIANPPAALAITRNGESIDRAEWNHELPIDGGAYQLAARLGGREVWSESITMAAERGARIVEIVLPVEPTTAVVQPAAPASPAAMAHAEPTVHASRRAAKVTTVGAGVLFGGALAFELIGRSTYNRAKQDNDVGLWNTANNQRYVGEAFAAGGLICAGVAVYLWLRDDKPEQRVARVTPAAGSGTAGLVLTGRW